MKILSLGCLISILSGLAFAQMTINATGPIHERKRQPSSGSGGSSGYKLPIQISLERKDIPTCGDNRVTINLTLINQGSKEIEIPISPNEGDFEPKDPKVSYSVKALKLYLTLDTTDRATRQRAIVPGGTTLFGSAAIQQTLISLAPKKSINVLTCVSLPARNVTSSRVIVGRLELENETISTVQGQTSSETREIGSAESQDYSLDVVWAPKAN